MAEDTRHQDRESDPEMELNLTPMIDIVFQLLIFFILAGKFREPEGRLDANLPQDGGPDKGVDAVEDVRLTFRISRENPNEPDLVVELGEERFRGVRILEAGDPVLKALKAKVDIEKQGVVIVSEGEVKFDWIIKALNASARAGFKKISFSPAIDSAGGVKVLNR